MALLIPARRPEPEVMDEAEEVEAYASAAAQAHLDALDNRFIEQIVALGIREGAALDAGCGPGQIVMKLARALPDLRVAGVDRSAAMLRTAAREAAAQGLSSRTEFVRSDANRLSFRDGSFNLVISNSVLHHLSDPVNVLGELGRVTKHGGKVLLRDLRRPSRPLFAFAAWHGRHYSGRMRRLFEDSLRAAYTTAELLALLDRSLMKGAAVQREDTTHMTMLWENRINTPRRAL